MFVGAGSLKAKRQGLRSLIDRVRSKYNVAVAEVAHQDSWQRSTVGLCVVGNDGGHVQSMLDKISGFVERTYLAQVLGREVELVHYEDEDSWDVS